MKTSLKSLVVASVLGVGGLAFSAAPARAQGFSFGYTTPGFALGVGSGYGAPVYGGYYGYPPVAPPVVVRPPLVVPRPIYAAPYVVARPIYGPRFYGYGYRPYRRLYW
jgi:hypothetical protein